MVFEFFYHRSPSFPVGRFLAEASAAQKPAWVL